MSPGQFHTGINTAAAAPAAGAAATDGTHH